MGNSWKGKRFKRGLAVLLTGAAILSKVKCLFRCLYVVNDSQFPMPLLMSAVSSKSEGVLGMRGRCKALRFRVDLPGVKRVPSKMSPGLQSKASTCRDRCRVLASLGAFFHSPSMQPTPAPIPLLLVQVLLLRMSASAQEVTAVLLASRGGACLACPSPGFDREGPEASAQAGRGGGLQEVRAAGRGRGGAPPARPQGPLTDPDGHITANL